VNRAVRTLTVELAVDPIVDAPHALVGAMFSTPKELRHLAEQQFGDLFVPTEVISENAHSAVIALRPDNVGTLVVHAERERHWYPYRVTRVEPLTYRHARAG
jgi:hypothetical protein